MTIHLYAQYQWHDDAYIAADRASLVALKAAIEKALERPDGLASSMGFAEDGEGYDIQVLCVSDETAAKLALPYTSEIAAEKKETAVWPWSIIQAAREKEGK